MTTHQITFSVMPWPQTAPLRFTHLKSRPSVTFAAALQQSIAVLTPAGNWNGSHMAAFAVKIENEPSFIALPESLKLQFGYFVGASLRVFTHLESAEWEALGVH